jgi:D-alanyl-lipoteichoic acid acyltransferase DltB (MBOAT superfamily)
MVIADRLAILVDTVYGNPMHYEGLVLILATVFFAIQIYCDFSGYTDIAIGSAKVLGYKLSMNFDRPYFSKSIAEFWRRWNISLNTWLRDYLYIPLGGNRVKPWRRYANIMIVFLVSGLWHGAAISFVVWGFLHGLYQVMGIMTKGVREKLVTLMQINKATFSHKLYQALATFALVCFAWIFFRANSVSDAIYIVRHLFTPNYEVFFDDTIYTLGLDRKDMQVAYFSISLLLFLDWLNRDGKMYEKFLKQHLVFRWAVYFAFIFGTLIFGIYGPGYVDTQFIYFQF